MQCADTTENQICLTQCPTDSGLLRIHALLARAAIVVLVSGASLYLLVYVGMVCARLPYMYELEWMEGGSVCHVQQVLDGKPLYGRPALDFIPYFYTPLYWYVCAGVARVMGNGFFALRLVSVVASLGCFCVLYLIVYRRTASRLASYLAVCLFAASFQVAGAFYDVARVDSLFLFFVLASLYAYDSPKRFVRSFISPVILFLAFFTKQTALPIGVALSLGAFITHKGWERISFPAVFGLLVLVASSAMDRASSGWYNYYVFFLPSHHAIVKGNLYRYWTDTVVGNFPIALVFCLIPVFQINSRRGALTRGFQDILVLGCLVGSSWISILHFTSYDNVYMPLCAGIAIYFGIGLAWVLREFGRTYSIRLLLFMAAILQFLNLSYNPVNQIPSREHRQATEALIRRLGQFSGEVHYSAHPWYLAMMGKPTQGQDMGFLDTVFARGTEGPTSRLKEEYGEAIRQERYQALVMDMLEYSPVVTFVPDFDEYYQLVDSHLTGERANSLTSWTRRPMYLYVRKSDLRREHSERNAVEDGPADSK